MRLSPAPLQTPTYVAIETYNFPIKARCKLAAVIVINLLSSYVTPYDAFRYNKYVLSLGYNIGMLYMCFTCQFHCTYACRKDI